MSGKTKLIRSLLFIILVIFAIYTLLPIFWVFVTSLKTPEEARSFPPSLIPKEVTFQNMCYNLSIGCFCFFTIQF